MYKCSFSSTGDGFLVGKLDQAYPIVNIEFINYICNGIKK